jgi:hypothetical protein
MPLLDDVEGGRQGDAVGLSLLIQLHKALRFLIIDGDSVGNNLSWLLLGDLMDA